MPTALIVDCVGPHIFTNELHEPVALPIIECVVKRLGCVGDLSQIRSFDREGVGPLAHLIDVVWTFPPGASLQGCVSFFGVRGCGRTAGGSPGLQLAGRHPHLGASHCDVVQRGLKAGPMLGLFRRQAQVRFENRDTGISTISALTDCWRNPLRGIRLAMRFIGRRYDDRRRHTDCRIRYTFA